MSDDYLRIIPTDAALIPSETVADKIVKLMEQAFPEADRVVAEDHGHPVFIDQGANLEAVFCPACGQRLPFEHADEVDVDGIGDWWYELTDSLRDADASVFQVSMPCCEAGVPFAELRFDWPAGVASFEISIMNPRVSEPPAAPLQRQVEALLRSGVRYVWAHY